VITLKCLEPTQHGPKLCALHMAPTMSDSSSTCTELARPAEHEYKAKHKKEASVIPSTAARTSDGNDIGGKNASIRSQHCIAELLCVGTPSPDIESAWLLHCHPPCPVLCLPSLASPFNNATNCYDATRCKQLACLFLSCIL
jgi:hypothetical protein